MRFNRRTPERQWEITDSFTPTWRQRVAILFGRAIQVRFNTMDSRLTVACHLSWRTAEDAQWHVSNPME